MASKHGLYLMFTPNSKITDDILSRSYWITLALIGRLLSYMSLRRLVCY